MLSPAVRAVVCDWRLDSEGMVSFQEMTSSGSGCTLPPDFKGWKISTRIVDEYGHELDGDADPKGKHGCRHTDSPEWKAAHPRPHRAAAKVAPPKKKEPVMDNLIPEASAEVPAPVTTASVSVPTDGIDLSQVLPKDGNITGGTVALALIVVAGGLAMKFLPSQLKARNEREAKKLELEEQRLSQQKEQQDQSHKCDASHAQLASQISTLSAKIDGVAQQASSLSFGDDFSPEEFIDWREQVDKVLKLKTAKKVKKSE